MSMDAKEEFRQLVDSTARGKESHYYYSAGIPADVISADPATRSIVVRVTATENEISCSGSLDEGVVSTIADYWTSTLITAVNGGKSAVTTSLGVQALKRIEPGTVLHIKCQATDAALAMPHATATFASAENEGDVYALATHTKYFKPLKK
ncbi:hypothetical protein GQ54DRAFT_198091 [Martensiomyces pterosporus]|nr:hypothetical protein GQ54DRAFT_198091 [Martensiomyces pterosporus]